MSDAVSQVEGLSESTGVVLLEGLGFDGVSEITHSVGAPYAVIQLYSAGYCEWEDPATDCLATAVYRALAKNYTGTLVYAWSITAGTATISGATNQETVTVVSTSATDSTYTLELTISTTVPESDTVSRSFTNEHQEATVPAAPTALTATAASDSQIDLTWTDNSTNEDSYTVERSDTVSGPWALIATLAADSSSYSDTGSISPETTYYYRVRAVNDFGYGEDTATGVSGASAPTNLTATAADATTIDLAWDDNSNIETGYSIERNDPWVEIDTVAAGVVTYSDTGLLDATTYEYRVRASSPAGYSSYSNTASDTTPIAPPQAPADFQVVTYDHESVDLGWIDVGTETSYTVERSPDGVGSWADVSGAIAMDITIFSDTGLSAATTYYYRAYSSNSGGDSGYTDVVSVTTETGLPASPTSLVVENNGSTTQLDLTWVDNSNNEDNYYVEVSTDGISFTPLHTLAANAVSDSHTGLTEYVRRYYRVYADNTTGNSSYSNIADAWTDHSSGLQSKDSEVLIADKQGGAVLDKTG